MGHVAVLTNGNYFATRVLAPLLRGPDGGGARLYLIPASGSLGSRGSATQLLRTWGVRYSTYKVATQFALPAAGRLRGRPVTADQLGGRLGLQRETVADANDEAFVAALAAEPPEVLVSVSCPYILRPPVLATPTIGALNVHSSLLPAYAGVSTYMHQLAEGVSPAGVTVHEMVERLDAGVIVRQSETEVLPGESAFNLFRRLCEIGGELLADAVREVRATGEVRGVPQDLSRRSYRKEPTAAEVAAMRARGHRLARLADLTAALRDA